MSDRGEDRDASEYRDAGERRDASEHRDRNESEPEATGALGRAWQLLFAAGGWVADTFRGHSGARDLKNRGK